MITEIRYLDCCTPDYFQGYAGVVLAVSVDDETTWQMLRDGIEEDSNAADYGTDDWTGFEEALAAWFEELRDRMDEVPFFAKGIPVYDADEMPESCYAYFGLVEEK